MGKILKAYSGSTLIGKYDDITPLTNIIYNGTTLKTLGTTGTVTLNTTNKVCQNDILLNNIKLNTTNKFMSDQLTISTNSQDYTFIGVLRVENGPYIQLDVVPTDTTGMLFEIQDLQTHEDLNFIGSRIQGGQRFQANVTGNKWGCAFSSYDVTPIDFILPQHDEFVTVRLNYMNDRKMSVSNSSTVFNITNHITSTLPPIALFGQNIDGAVIPENRYMYKLGRVAITNNKTVIRDLRPAIRNYDNIAGLYCRITGKFYTNVGTSSFSVGVEV